MAFAVASAAFVLAGDPSLLGVAQFGQGAAVAAFSPSAGEMIARLAPDRRSGRAFGSYGHGRAWATPWGRSSVVAWSYSAATRCCS